MSYTKNTWTDGDIITSAKLNNIENGIENTNIMVVTVTANDSGLYTADKTYEEILSALNAGIYVVAFVTFQDGYTQCYPCMGFSDEQAMIGFSVATVGEGYASTDGFNVTPIGWLHYTAQYPPQNTGTTK